MNSTPIFPKAYWLTAVNQGIICQDKKPLLVSENSLLLKTLYSGISPGTERLVASGRIPKEAYLKMACRYMQGNFAFPLKYGYCLIGTEINDTQKQTCYFVMHPHQDNVSVSKNDARIILPNIPAQRAVLFPNLETALNAFWDARLSQTSRVAVVGAGLVGILIAYVISEKTGLDPVVFEKDPQRCDLVSGLSWIKTIYEPAFSRFDEFTHVFHTSAQADGLQYSINIAGFEGTVIEVSWYGNQTVSLKLGGSFHYDRKKIISSQVSAVAAPVRDHLDHEQRAAKVFELLSNDVLDTLLMPQIQFENLPEYMADLYQHGSQGYCPLVCYP